MTTMGKATIFEHDATLTWRRNTGTTYKYQLGNTTYIHRAERNKILPEKAQWKKGKSIIMAKQKHI